MIRRKVFSYVEPEERLYSTGNDELDYLLEKAFSEGYEYAQREFAGKKEDEEEDEMSTAAKIGIGSAAALTAAAGGLYAGKKGLLGNAVRKHVNKGIIDLGRKTGNKKVFDSALDDYAKAVVKEESGVSAKQAAKSNFAEKRSYVKHLKDVKDRVKAAFESEQAIKNVGKGPKGINKK